MMRDDAVERWHKVIDVAPLHDVYDIFSLISPMSAVIKSFVLVSFLVLYCFVARADAASNPKNPLQNTKKKYSFKKVNIIHAFFVTLFVDPTYKGCIPISPKRRGKK